MTTKAVSYTQQNMQYMQLKTVKNSVQFQLAFCENCRFNIGCYF